MSDILSSWKAWPKPGDVAEGVLMTADQMQRWVNSMPKELQDGFFAFVGDRLDNARKCLEMDHEGQMEYHSQQNLGLSRTNRALVDRIRALSAGIADPKYTDTKGMS